jgi:peptidyl-dipeptidase Dcp
MGMNGPIWSRGTGATTPRSGAGEHDLDEAELKPYFQLDAMIEAAFDCANRLFGLEFEAARRGRSITPTRAPGR